MDRDELRKMIYSPMDESSLDRLIQKADNVIRCNRLSRDETIQFLATKHGVDYAVAQVITDYVLYGE